MYINVTEREQVAEFKNKATQKRSMQQINKSPAAYICKCEYFYLCIRSSRLWWMYHFLLFFSPLTNSLVLANNLLYRVFSKTCLEFFLLIQSLFLKFSRNLYLQVVSFLSSHGSDGAVKCMKTGLIISSIWRGSEIGSSLRWES